MTSTSPPPDLIPECWSDTGNLSFRSRSARLLVAEVLEKLPPSLSPHGPVDWDGDFDSIPHGDHRDPGLAKRELKVCIVGAGVAGMRIAMFLQFLGVKYDILEASDRHGGRVFTHHFSRSNHDYYDVGAMRFPKIKALEQTFELFKELGLTTSPGGKLIPYIMSTPANIQLFNDVAVTNNEAGARDNPHNDSGIPLNCLKFEFTSGKRKYKGAAALAAKAMEPFKKALVRDFKTGWVELMRQDHLTTRAFMSAFLVANNIVLSPFWVVQWMERMNSSTGSYDFAFSQEVLESMEFDYPDGSSQPPRSDQSAQDWVCVDGGTEVITDRMQKSIAKKKLDYNHRVVAIRAEEKKGGPPEMFVEVQGYPQYQKQSYAHIVITTPLSCVNRMDLTKAQLTENQKQGIRSLSYGSAVKIGIKFKTRWWQEITGFAQMGGVSYTDRPIRVVVYPSYGLGGPKDDSGVLIASYAWTQDASRLGADIQGNRSVPEKNLLDIVYNNLAAMHHRFNGKSAQWYKEQTISHFAHDWYHDEFTAGGMVLSLHSVLAGGVANSPFWKNEAYAQFHPGQYHSTYPEMTKPAAKGYLHFSGEAMSAHHAWIEGALVAAWRSVNQILVMEDDKALIRKFRKKWPPPGELNVNMERWQVARGVWGIDHKIEPFDASASVTLSVG